MPPLISIIIGGVLVGIVAIGMGFIVLRLRGMYFAITTMAASEIFKIIIRNWNSVTRGPEGLVLPDVIFGGSSFGMYWLTLGLLFSVLPRESRE
jgi:branched-chain amino acid transport system permease protein